VNPGRNDPCHCGSGRKYKVCCARADAAASPALRLAGHDTERELRASAAEAIRRSVPWEADITPVPIRIASEPAGRPAAILVAANGLVLSVDVAMHAPSDAAGVAELLRAAIAKVLATGGATPTQVSVRHEAVADQLRPLLRELGITTVVSNPTLAMIAEIGAELRRQMSGLDMDIPAISNPDMWAAWDFPADIVHDLFVAAAEFYRAAPWRELANEHLLDLDLLNGSRWSASILGQGGQQYGLVLYESSNDFLSFLESPDPAAGFAAHRHAVLSLSFDARGDIPKPMRREITQAGWPVAGPSAYPNMWALNTIGGGLSVAQARDMTSALGVVARFAGVLGASRSEGSSPLPVPWTDASGCSVRPTYDMEVEPLWEVPSRLTTSMAEGSAANPLALSRDEKGAETLERNDAAMIGRFAASMQAGQVDEQRAATDRMNADLFATVMRGELGVFLPAVSELDLRIFLYDLLPRKMMGSRATANGIRTSLRRFVDHLAAHEGLRYPWARAILRDKRAFEERWDTFPSGNYLDPSVAEWMSELTEDLMARAFMPARELAGAGEWSAAMGFEEVTLYDELQRLWLRWRDEEIRLGNDVPHALVARLVARQDEWALTPQLRLTGRSPIRAITAERKRNRRE